MGTGKIELQFGTFAFRSEGEEKWVTEQFDKALKHVDKLKDMANIGETQKDPADNKKPAGNNATTLPSFLKAHGATENQTKKFLATVAWYRLKGQSKVGTSDVTRALKDNHQSRLGNASECLSRNVAQGFIEKDGKAFYITDEGMQSLNLSQ